MQLRPGFKRDSIPASHRRQLPRAARVRFPIPTPHFLLLQKKSWLHPSMRHRRWHPQPYRPLSWVRTGTYVRQPRRGPNRASIAPHWSHGANADRISARGGRRGEVTTAAWPWRTRSDGDPIDGEDVDVDDEAARSCFAPLFPSPHSYSLIAQTLASLLTCSRAQL